MRKNAVFLGLSFVLFVLPALVSAQPVPVPVAQTGQGIINILGLISTILNSLIGILITLAVIVFFWGLVQYLVSVGDEKSKGLQTMMWGVIAIFVMVSIWGIIRLLQNTLGVQDSRSLSPQGVPFTAGQQKI